MLNACIQHVIGYSVIHCPEGTMAMSLQWSTTHFSRGEKRRHTNVFDRVPTKQLSLYPRCRTALFVFTARCIPNYFITLLGTAISDPQCSTISKPSISFSAEYLAHKLCIANHISLPYFTASDGNEQKIQLTVRAYFCRNCAHCELCTPVNTPILHDPVYMNNIKPTNAERTANTFTWTGCKGSARQPSVKNTCIVSTYSHSCLARIITQLNKAVQRHKLLHFCPPATFTPTTICDYVHQRSARPHRKHTPSASRRWAK